MKKYETLKAIVILQAVSMIALAGFVIWHMWPNAGDDEAILPAHDLSKANAEDEVVAVIAEQKITKKQLVDELLLLHGDETLQSMLEHYAIQFASKEYNIVVTKQEVHEQLTILAEHYDSVEQYIKLMTEQVGILPSKLYQNIENELLLTKIAIKDISVSDEEVQAYLADHPNAFASHYALGLEWIVLDNNEQAHELLDRIADGESFQALAIAYSLDDYTSANGGKLGLIDEDDPFYPKVLRETASALEVGSVAGPIRLEKGYAIVKLVEKKVVKYIEQNDREQLVRQQLALNQADSLDQVLQRLINQYGSAIKKQNL